MTKTEIIDVLDNHSFKVYQHGDVVSKSDFNTIAEIISERLSEQKEKHEKEMEEFLYWTYLNGYTHSVTPNFFIKIEYPDIVVEKIPFIELLTKFKNR